MRLMKGVEGGVVGISEGFELAYQSIWYGYAVRLTLANAVRP
jgi:hypothetical protein